MAITSMDVNHRLDDVIASQKVEGDLKLIVKNTFFDVDENVPEMIGLVRRSVTAPPSMLERLCEEDGEELEDLVAPGPLLLARDTTFDSFECGLLPEASMWSGLPMLSMQAAVNQDTVPLLCVQLGGGQWEPMGGGYSTTGGFLPPKFDMQAEMSHQLEEAPMGFQLPVQTSVDQDTSSVQPGGNQWGEHFVALDYLPPKFDMDPDMRQSQMMAEHVPMLPDAQLELAGHASNELNCEQEWDKSGQPSSQPFQLQTLSQWTDQSGQPSSQPFQPQTLSQWTDRAAGGSTFINWTVDAKKLRANDRLTVSPLFKLCDGNVNAPPLPFKMTVTPKMVSDGKGGASFRKAKGKAIIQLKCEAPREDMESNPIRFYLSAWSGRQEDPRMQAARGPVTCNFAQSGICGLPKDREIWDFPSVVDEQSQTFVISLEVLAPRLQ